MSRTWCSDMRSPWECRTVVTCGDHVAAWETPDMYLRPRVLIRVRAVVRQWLIGIDRSRHCATPTSSGREISPINSPLNAGSLFLFLSPFSSRKAKYLFSAPLFSSRSLITFFRPDPKARALGERLTREYKGIRRLRNAFCYSNITYQSAVINLSYSLVAIGMVI